MIKLHSKQNACKESLIYHVKNPDLWICSRWASHCLQPKEQDGFWNNLSDECFLLSMCIKCWSLELFSVAFQPCLLCPGQRNRLLWITCPELAQGCVTEKNPAFTWSMLQSLEQEFRNVFCRNSWCIEGLSCYKLIIWYRFSYVLISFLQVFYTDLNQEFLLLFSCCWALLIQLKFHIPHIHIP